MKAEQWLVHSKHFVNMKGKKEEEGPSKREKWLQIQKQPSSSQNSESNGLVGLPERNGIQKKQLLEAMLSYSPRPPGLCNFPDIACNWKH